MPNEPFHLNIQVSRPDVIEWLTAIPTDKLPGVVENTLAAGNLVLSLLQASAGEESMQRFFRPVLEPMNDLKGTIERILRATQKSQGLGEFGEEVVAQQLKSAFPGDDFQVVSKEGHLGDIHATFAINNEQFRKALIEVKLYSDDVPSDQIDKFRRDLETTGFGFGLMVSLKSRLTGITGPLHLEQTPGYIAVYVPDAGLEGYRLLCAVALLKTIVLYQARTTHLIPAGAIEQAWIRLNAELEELKEVAAEVNDLRSSLLAAQQDLNNILVKVMEKAISADCRLRHAVQRISLRFAEELGGLSQSTRPSLPVVSPDAVLVFLDILRRKDDCRLRAFEAIYNLTQRMTLQIRLDEQHWQLLRDGVVLAWTGGNKNRLDVCVPVDFHSNPEILVDTRLEKINNDHITINGNVVEQMLSRLEKRLATC